MAEEVKDPSQQTSEAEESMKNAAEAAETDAAADVATETEAAAAEADKTAELQQKIEALEKELADEKEQFNAMKSRWEAEKSGVDSVKQLKSQIEQKFFR